MLPPDVVTVVGTNTYLLAPTVMEYSAVLKKVMSVSPLSKPETLLTVMVSLPCFAMCSASCVVALPVSVALLME